MNTYKTLTTRERVEIYNAKNRAEREAATIARLKKIERDGQAEIEAIREGKHKSQATQLSFF